MVKQRVSFGWDEEAGWGATCSAEKKRKQEARKRKSESAESRPAKKPRDTAVISANAKATQADLSSNSMAGFLGFLVGDDLVDQILAYAEQLKDYTMFNFLCDAFNMLPSDTQQDDDVLHRFISCFHCEVGQEEDVLQEFGERCLSESKWHDINWIENFCYKHWRTTDIARICDASRPQVALVETRWRVPVLVSLEVLSGGCRGW